MTIPSSKYLKNKARNRLASGKEPQKVMLWYVGISAVLTLLVAALRYFLSTQISKTGGLQNIGTRSILSTMDTLLPILQLVILMCLGLGYTAAMLRISRRQYVSPKTLKAGLERFWPLLLSKVLQGLIYAGAAFLIVYLATAIFLLTPLSNSFTEQLMPLVATGTLTPETLLQDDALMTELSATLTPVILIYAVLYIPAVAMISYRYRMTDFIIVDQPGCGALNAMRQSKYLMRGNKVKLFRVDLSFWWYHLLRMLATGVLYLDQVLMIFGKPLMLPEVVSFFGLAIAYLAVDFAISFFFLNYESVTMALAYTSIVPKKEETNTAVLGNIFNV